LTANRAIEFVIEGNDFVDVQSADGHPGLVVKVCCVSSLYSKLTQDGDRGGSRRSWSALARA
jgi:hypothetical protein